MAHKILRQEQDRRIVQFYGITKYTGCQCFKDCTCREDFKEEPYNYYVVTRRIGTKKQKTTHHNTMEEVEERWEYIKTLEK